MGRKNTFWIKGAFAFRRGVADCPYPEDSYQGRDWIAGWRSAHEKAVIKGKAVPLSSVKIEGVDAPPQTD